MDHGRHPHRRRAARDHGGDLAAIYGGPLAPIMANNVQQDTDPGHSIADPLPTAVAVAYGAPVGMQRLGPIIPAPLLSM